MYKPQSIHTETALKSVLCFLETGKYLDEAVPGELKNVGACFVTLRDKNGNLRGCIGTLSPVRSSLHSEIIRNAVSAALHDSRFEPLTRKELETVSFSVEVLNTPEEIISKDMLDPKRYGLIISDFYGRRGVLLPDIEGVDSVEEQIRIVMRKGNISVGENLSMKRFTTQKFY